jgi:hypothetical protein
VKDGALFMSADVPDVEEPLTDAERAQYSQLMSRVATKIVRDALKEAGPFVPGIHGARRISWNDGAVKIENISIANAVQAKF